jgi:hypothetical protein
MESNVKKTYAPKANKVEKLKTYMASVKVANVVKCDLFTKTAKALILMLLITGCSAEYHIEKACKKQPELCKVKVKIDTFIVRDSIYFYDTFTTKEIDTIQIDTGSVRVKIIRHFNKIKVMVRQKPDTIRIQETITLPPKVVIDAKEKAWTKAHSVFFWVGVILCAFGFYKLIK